MTGSIYCQVRVRGHLSSQWTDGLGRLAIENRPDGEALLSGPLPDQAALYGVVERMRDLGLELVFLNRIGPDSGERGKA